MTNVELRELKTPDRSIYNSNNLRRLTLPDVRGFFIYSFRNKNKNKTIWPSFQLMHVPTTRVAPLSIPRLMEHGRNSDDKLDRQTDGRTDGPTVELSKNKQGGNYASINQYQDS